MYAQNSKQPKEQAQPPKAKAPPAPVATINLSLNPIKKQNSTITDTSQQSLKQNRKNKFKIINETKGNKNKKRKSY